MARLLTLLCFLSGCWWDQGEAQALDTVWTKVYQQKGPFPHVDWVDQLHLDCAPIYTPPLGDPVPDGQARAVAYYGFVIPDEPTTAPHQAQDADHPCTAGVWFDVPFTTMVSAPYYIDGQVSRISQTTFSHELNHARLGVVNGYSDPNHLDSSWSWIVGAANGALQFEGL